MATHTTRRTPARAKKKPPRDPWTAAKRRRVVRGNWIYPPEPLEPGVKFFVLMLEQLGARTTWSCEGHPHGFYVVFQAELALVVALQGLGFLTVALCDQGWRLSLESNEVALLRSYGGFTREDRDSCLRGAAQAWQKYFGPLRRRRASV